MSKYAIYREVINFLSCLELIIKDEEQFKLLRKKLLDIANDVKRIE